jgi:integrase
MNLVQEAGWEDLVNSTAEAERLQRWGQAYANWVGNLQAQYSQNVWEDAHHAWKEFNATIHKPPWEVKPEQVDQYRNGLVERGLRPATIRQRLVNLRRFYDFCVQGEVEGELAGGKNPFTQVEWPKERSYERPTYLQPADERKFLRTIQRDPSVIGQRDAALFGMLLSTGRPAGEIRRLRWQDLAIEGDQAWILSKGDGERQLIPAATWKAIENWLMASGRLEGMQAEDFVFTPSKDPLVREARDQAEDWARERPLSIDEVNYLLKLYAGWTGLNPDQVTCHTLRNTAARRMLERGESCEAIQASTGRRDFLGTRKYLKKLAQDGEPIRHSRLWLIRKNDAMPSRKPGRAEPGNRRGLRHGLYAKSLPEMETLEEMGMHFEGRTLEIVRNRMVLLRIATFYGEPKSLEEALTLLRVTGRAATRVANLIYKIHLDQSKDQFTR